MKQSTRHEVQERSEKLLDYMHLVFYKECSIETFMLTLVWTMSAIIDTLEQETEKNVLEMFIENLRNLQEEKHK